MLKILGGAGLVVLVEILFKLVVEFLLRLLVFLKQLILQLLDLVDEHHYVISLGSELDVVFEDGDSLKRLQSLGAKLQIARNV